MKMEMLSSISRSTQNNKYVQHYEKKQVIFLGGFMQGSMLP